MLNLYLKILKQKRVLEDEQIMEAMSFGSEMLRISYAFSYQEKCWKLPQSIF